MNRNWKQMTANMLVLVSLAGQSALAGGNHGGGSNNHGGGNSQGQGNARAAARPSFSDQTSGNGLSNALNNSGNALKGSVRTMQPAPSFSGQFTKTIDPPLASTQPRHPREQQSLGNKGLQQLNGGKIQSVNLDTLKGVTTQVQKGNLNVGNLTTNQALNSNAIKHLKPIGLNGSPSKPGLPNGLGKKIDPIFSQSKKGVGQSFYCGNGGFGNNFCGNGWLGNGNCGNGWYGNGCCNNFGGWYGNGYWGCGHYGYGCGNWFGNSCGCYYPVVQPYPLTVCPPIYVTQPATVVQVAPVTTTMVQEVAPELPPAPATAREIDLAIKEVKVLAKGDAQNGPMYRVFITNKGPMNLDQPSRVALISINDGKPSADTPRMIETLKSLKVGETAELDMRLPVAANTFPMLLVAVEVPETFKDTNEQDNVAQGEVAQLPLAVAAAK